ncbi:MAG: hypothetical protein PVH25_14115 [Burkholderiales bacterium]|jgi:hypothetical protein
MTNANSKAFAKTNEQASDQYSPVRSSARTRNEIAGHFSLIGNGPVVIDSTPGVVLHVRSGLVQICHNEEEGQHLVQGGQKFILDRSGPVGLAAIDRAEVQLEWPSVRTPSIPRAMHTQQQFAFV